MYLIAFLELAAESAQNRQKQRETIALAQRKCSKKGRYQSIFSKKNDSSSCQNDEQYESKWNVFNFKLDKDVQATVVLSALF